MKNFKEQLQSDLQQKQMTAEQKQRLKDQLNKSHRKRKYNPLPLFVAVALFFLISAILINSFKNDVVRTGNKEIQRATAYIDTEDRMDGTELEDSYFSSVKRVNEQKITELKKMLTQAKEEKFDEEKMEEYYYLELKETSDQVKKFALFIDNDQYYIHQFGTETMKKIPMTISETEQFFGIKMNLNLFIFLIIVCITLLFIPNSLLTIKKKEEYDYKNKLYFYACVAITIFAVAFFFLSYANFFVFFLLIAIAHWLYQLYDKWLYFEDHPAEKWLKELYEYLAIYGFAFGMIGNYYKEVDLYYVATVCIGMSLFVFIMKRKIESNPCPHCEQQISTKRRFQMMFRKKARICPHCHNEIHISKRPFDLSSFIIYISISGNLFLGNFLNISLTYIIISAIFILLTFFILTVFKMKFEKEDLPLW